MSELAGCPKMTILIQGTSVSSKWSGLLWDGFHGNSAFLPRRLRKDASKGSSDSMAKAPSAGDGVHSHPPLPALGPQALENLSPVSVLSHTGSTLTPGFSDPAPAYSPHQDFARPFWLHPP